MRQDLHKKLSETLKGDCVISGLKVLTNIYIFLKVTGYVAWLNLILKAYVLVDYLKSYKESFSVEMTSYIISLSSK